MKKNDQINSATAFSPPAPFPALLPPRRIALSSPLRPQHAPSVAAPYLPPPFPRLPVPPPCSGKLPPAPPSEPRVNPALTLSVLS